MQISAVCSVMLNLAKLLNRSR